MHCFHDLLSVEHELPADSAALVVDWISWSRQARGTTSRLARSVTLSLRKFMAMGKPACFLMRVSTPRAGWNHVMKDWKPLITHHCVHMLDPEAPRMSRCVPIHPVYNCIRTLAAMWMRPLT